MHLNNELIFSMFEVSSYDSKKVTFQIWLTVIHNGGNGEVMKNSYQIVVNNYEILSL